METIQGDLADEPALRRLCAGADVVIHAAGLVKAGSRTAFHAVNIEGSRNLARAATNAPHVVFVSSLTAREPHLSHYAQSKSAAEAAMSDILAERLSIVRPCAIYGPGDRELLPVFRAATISPVLPILNSRARISMIHVADAATQVVAITGGAPLDRPIALCDDQPQGYAWRELMSRVAQAVGRRPAILSAPRLAVQTIGVFNDVAAAMGAAPMLTGAKVRELLHPDWSVHPYELALERPVVRHNLDTGFQDTVRGYRTAGWLKQ